MTKENTNLKKIHLTANKPNNKQLIILMKISRQTLGFEKKLSDFCRLIF